MQLESSLNFTSLSIPVYRIITTLKQLSSRCEYTTESQYTHCDMGPRGPDHNEHLFDKIFYHTSPTNTWGSNLSIDEHFGLRQNPQVSKDRNYDLNSYMIHL